MEFKRRSLKVNVYGVAHELHYPTVGESKVYSKEVRGLENDEATDALLGFLEKLGLPRNVSEDMESEHLEQLVGALVPNKKK